MAATTFASQCEDLHDVEARPWIYAFQWGDGGHSIDVAHCAEDCKTPGDCACEEVTHLDWETLSSTFLLAREHGVITALHSRDLTPEDVDKLMQACIYGGIVFE